MDMISLKRAISIEISIERAIDIELEMIENDYT